jgi:tRNA pseudouridine38-40 synthase
VPTFKLTIAYDGAAYAGWQAQPAVRTVQGTFEATLEKITGESVRVTASGRTDAGVHALGQVVSLVLSTSLPPDVLLRAFNAELPNDIAVLSAEIAVDGFHAIRDARRKRYRYLLHDGPVRSVLWRRYCWHLPYQLDEGAMHRAAQGLVGTHDYSSFETSGTERLTSIRTVFALSVTRRPTDELLSRADQDLPLVAVEIEADGFLYNMVRAIVGTLVEVGRGTQTEAWPAEVLAAGDRRAAGRTAPPQGLFLVEVQYDPPTKGG